MTLKAKQAETGATTKTQALKAKKKKMTSEQKQNHSNEQKLSQSNYLEKLGQVNRHWYRRRLDTLDEMLRTTTQNPGIRETQVLCERIVMSFLTAVVGQGKGTKLLQFPVDRACFIPFDGDKVRKVQHANSFYQFPEKTPARQVQGIKNSLWSFFPVLEGFPTPEVSDESIDENYETISLKEMLSVGQKFLGGKDFQVRKALFLEKRGLPEIKEILARSPKREKLLRQVMVTSQRAIFEIYRRIPGNTSLELLLFQHLRINEWLHSVVNSEIKEHDDSILKKDEDDLFFEDILKTTLIHEDYAHQKELEKVREAVIAYVFEWIKKSRDAIVPIEELWAEVSEHQELLNDVRDEGELEKFVLDLRSFYYFYVEGEKRLEKELDEILTGNPLKAGNTTKSFIWGVRDYAELGKSLPYEQALGVERIATLDDAHEVMADPLELLFEILEVESIDDFSEDLIAYWRTREDANRRAKIYSSFENEKRGLVMPRDKQRIAWQSMRSQNVFVRVKVCDSLNEPQINGLFVFSFDRDEALHGFKDEERFEDAQDLLAFAKVFFYGVRDFFYAQDRAREANDIGMLNQHLFDRRLSMLKSTMDERREIDELEERSITDQDNWDKFIFAIINNYADALVDQPRQVARESFPYDRLLVMPYGSRDGISSREIFSLPFFAFQALFAQRSQEGIDRDHYSLIKPFQSPLDTVAGEGFARTFQRESEEAGEILSLHKYLEKYYLGTWGRENRRDRTLPESFTLKMSPCESDRKNFQSEQSWCTWVIEELWKDTALPLTRRSKPDPEGMWASFLRGMTTDYRDLLNETVPMDQVPQKQMWLLFQLGFLGAVVTFLTSKEQEKSGNDKIFTYIHKQYINDLKLLFDAEPKLNILYLAGLDDSPLRPEKREDPFELFQKRNQSMLVNPLDDMSYVNFDLHLSNRLLLHYFEVMTRLCRNELPEPVEKKDDESKLRQTWYQPLLTRPLEDPHKSGGAEQTLMCEAGQAVKNRTPPYAEIKNEQEKISLTLAAINLRIGHSSRESRHFRATVLLIRDFDESKRSRTSNVESVREQLDVDIRDLTLFSTTFFKSAKEYMNDLLSKKRVSELSREVPQIGRNWYSGGVDRVVKRLSTTLEEQIKSSDPIQLANFHPELAENLFEEVLETLLGPEMGLNSQGRPQKIKMESFPFDRMLHIPLFEKRRFGASLSYARTTIQNSTENEPAVDWEKEGYSAIRRYGRIWDSEDGKKAIAGGFPVHIKQDMNILEWPFGHRVEELAREIHDIFNSPQEMGDLVAYLYKSNKIQSIALVGLMLHLVQLLPQDLKGKAKNAKESLAESQKRLQDVLRDQMKNLERELIYAKTDDETPVVQTHAHMERSSLLIEKYTSGDKDKTENRASKLLAALFDNDNDYVGKNRLPLFKPFFTSLEKNIPYGLKKGQASKVFFIYYSLETPDRFIEALNGEAHYRGVFCFVVDDTDTDDKSSEGGGLSDAELADREDIRTFIHNVMSSMRLIFEQQGLHSELLQPGVQQFLIGMLHRLKNELGKPNAVLSQIKRGLQVPHRLQEDKQRILKAIESAETAIYGIRNLFNGLKDLNDIDGSTVPLQKFSSRWLGWLFVHSLCQSVLNLIHPSDQQSSVILHIQERAASKMQESSERQWASEEIQRSLHQLQDVLETILDVKGARLPLSFQVYAGNVLFFRGSQFLQEALHTLIENAFQAFWSYVTYKKSLEKPFNARLMALCKPSLESHQEVLIEFTNSSQPINQDLLEELNAKVPAPISSQQHARKSGKKGGSGFGHYYSRRIISKYCGGQQARRRLDVELSYQDEMAKVLINLVKPNPKVAQKYSQDAIKQTCRNSFKELLKNGDGILDKGGVIREGCSLLFPGDLEPEGFFEVLKKFLKAEQQLVTNRIYNLVQNHLCGTIKRQVVTYKNILGKCIRAFEEKTESPSFKKDALLLLEELKNYKRLPKDSFEDFHGIFKRYKDLIEATFNELTTYRKLLFLTNLSGPADLIKDEAWEKCREDWQKISNYLKPECQAQGLKFLSSLIECDNEGIPQVSHTNIDAQMRPSRFQARFTSGDGQLRMVFRLSDGDTSELRWRNVGADTFSDQELRDRYRQDMIGRLYLQYKESICSPQEDTGQPIGSLFYDIHRPEDNRKNKTPYRSIYLTLNYYDPSQTNQGEGDEPTKV